MDAAHHLAPADEANPLAQAAFGGSVLTGWLDADRLALQARSAAAAPPITAADPFEKVVGRAAWTRTATRSC